MFPDDRVRDEAILEELRRHEVDLVLLLGYMKLLGPKTTAAYRGRIMQPKRLGFRPIDLDAHASVCVAFRRDSFICSFGVDRFFDEAGPDGEHYIERLRSRTAKFKDGYVHVWDNDRIVGQMEMQILEEPRRGYVNLFYLIEEMRGSGVSGELQHYAMSFMRHHGVQTAQLSVSPTNARALAYYRKHGWRDLGLRPGRDNVNLMECAVPVTAAPESSTVGRGA